MTEQLKGVLAIVGACTIWGMSGIYYKALAHVPPLEVLAHRTLWSAVFLGAVLLLQGRAAEVARIAGAGRVWAVLSLSALFISVNWFGFIFAIQSGQALEASLGYYIFPLVAAALGVAVLGERLTGLQGAAIGLAALAVALLTWGLGAAPWLALLLAGTFGGYGLVKSRLALGPVISVCFEAAMLTPLALVWLWGLGAGHWNDIGGREGVAFLAAPGTTALLVLSGPLMTGGPLVLFSYAARRVAYATLGMVQYLNPTLQFTVAVALFGEPFTPWHGLAFPMIWTGLALYSLELWRRERAARRLAMSSSTVA